MRCKRIRKRLSAYVTGDVSDVERARISDHIETCKSCRRELSGIESVIRDISQLDLLRPPDIYFEYFPKRVTSSIPDRSISDTGGKKRIFRLSFAAGTLVIALILVFFYTSTRKEAAFEDLSYYNDTFIYNPLPEVISASEEELIGAALEIGAEEVGGLEEVVETYEIWDESYDLSDEEWEEVLDMLEESFNENGV